MGRESDYGAQVAKDTAPIEKFGQSPMSTVEFAEYMNQKNLNHIQPRSKSTGFQQDYVRNKIQVICEYSGGLLPYEAFQSGNRGNIRIPKNCHGILLALIDTHFFDARHNQLTFDQIAKYDYELVKNIETASYLSESDRALIKSYPAFSFTTLNSRVQSLIMLYLKKILIGTNQLSPITRAEASYSFVRSLQAFSQTVQGLLFEESFARRSSFVPASDDEERISLANAQLNRYQLYPFMLALLALRMSNQDPKPYCDTLTAEHPDAAAHSRDYLRKTADQCDATVEKIKAEADRLQSLSAMHSQLNIPDDQLDRLESTINRDRQYQSLMRRLEVAMNMDDDSESELFYCFKEIAGIHYSTNYVEYSDILALRHPLCQYMNSFMTPDAASNMQKALDHLLDDLTQ